MFNGLNGCSHRPAPGRSNAGFGAWRRTLVVLAAALTLTPAFAEQQVELLWDPSPDSSVTGYRLYYRTLTDWEFTPVTVGPVTSHTLKGLREGETYLLFCTAYDQEGLESEPSNTVEVSIPLAPLTTQVSQDSLGRPYLRVQASGVAGRRIALETSMDLEHWFVVATSPPGQPISFTALAITGRNQQYFRVKLAE